MFLWCFVIQLSVSFSVLNGQCFLVKTFCWVSQGNGQERYNTPHTAQLSATKIHKYTRTEKIYNAKYKYTLPICLLQTNQNWNWNSLDDYAEHKKNSVRHPKQITSECWRNIFWGVQRCEQNFIMSRRCKIWSKRFAPWKKYILTD